MSSLQIVSDGPNSTLLLPLPFRIWALSALAALALHAPQRIGAFHALLTKENTNHFDKPSPNRELSRSIEQDFLTLQSRPLAHALRAGKRFATPVRGWQSCLQDQQ